MPLIAAILGLVGGYVLLVRGALTLDLGVGRLTATTVETGRFGRPRRVSFRALRVPVPHVVETYELEPADGGTVLVYRGELGTDRWRLGPWWGERVAAPWERTVERSLASIRVEAERRAG